MDMNMSWLLLLNCIIRQCPHFTLSLHTTSLFCNTFSPLDKHQINYASQQSFTTQPSWLLRKSRVKFVRPFVGIRGLGVTFEWYFGNQTLLFILSRSKRSIQNWKWFQVCLNHGVIPGTWAKTLTRILEAVLKTSWIEEMKKRKKHLKEPKLSLSTSHLGFC